MVGEPIPLLITGASGYLGSHLVRRAGPAWRPVGTYLTARPPDGLETHRLELRDGAAVEALLDRVRPSVVLHTAYRQQEPSVNLDGTRNLAAACARIGARLVFVSTDLVFDGRRGWYRESDPPSPIEPYGASKAAAEQEVLRRGGTVARTSLIYGFDPLDPHTERLVAGPLRHGQRPSLFVDEFRCPVYAPDLADALLELAAGDPSAASGSGPAPSSTSAGSARTPSSASAGSAQIFEGILHLAGPQRLSRYDYAGKLAIALGLDPAGLAPARIADSGLLRSPDCSLDTALAHRLLSTRLRSIDEVIATRPPIGVPFRST